MVSLRRISRALVVGHARAGRMILDARERQDGAPLSTNPTDFYLLPAPPIHLLLHSETLTCLLFLARSRSETNMVNFPWNLEGLVRALEPLLLMEMHLAVWPPFELYWPKRYCFWSQLQSKWSFSRQSKALRNFTSDKIRNMHTSEFKHRRARCMKCTHEHRSVSGV